MKQAALLGPRGCLLAVTLCSQPHPSEIYMACFPLLLEADTDVRKKREKKAKREEEIQKGRSSISRVEVATRVGLTKAPEKSECQEMPKSTEERLHSRTA